jgi:heme exporter protein D
VASPRPRGTFLLEALVSLTILGIVLTLGASFLARRRALEAERRDRDRAARALATEWTYLRTAFRHDLVPKDKRPFAGPGVFVDALDARDPFLRVLSTDVDGLFRVTLDIGYGKDAKKRLVQEGFVFRGAGPP